MAEQNETQAQPQAQSKRNKDGFMPGQRVTQKELAEHRNRQRKARK